MGWTGVFKVQSKTNWTIAPLAGPVGAGDATGETVSTSGSRFFWLPAGKARRAILRKRNETIIAPTDQRILPLNLPAWRLRLHRCLDAGQHSTTRRRKAASALCERFLRVPSSRSCERITSQPQRHRDAEKRPFDFITLRLCVSVVKRFLGIFSHLCRDRPKAAGGKHNL